MFANFFCGGIGYAPLMGKYTRNLMLRIFYLKMRKRKLGSRYVLAATPSVYSMRELLEL